MDVLKFKTIQHYEDAHHARELTFTCHHRKPYLNDDRACALLGEAITKACSEHQWAILAFVFMPDHVHLLLRPRMKEPDIPKLLHAIKRPVAYRAMRLEPDIVGMGKQFWQQGPGCDRNMWNPRVLRAAIEYIHANPLRKRLCRTPGDWLWSSWAQWFEPREPIKHEALPLIDRDALPPA